MISFDLLVPTHGDGVSHLRAPGTGRFVCGYVPGQRARFNMMGIVGANASTCDGCRRGAALLDADTDEQGHWAPTAAQYDAWRTAGRPLAR